MLCGSPSQLISNSFVRGEKGTPGQLRLLLSFHPTDSELLIKAIGGELNLIIFTKEYCTALHAALYTRYLWAYVFGIVSSQQEHVGFTCLSSFCVGFACSSLCLCSLQVLQLPLTVQKHVNVCINKMFLLSNLDSWQVLHYETEFTSHNKRYVSNRSRCAT